MQGEARIVGREPELAVLHEFVAGEPASRALVLTGEPGIGKTALWDAGLTEARKEGRRVLAARPAEAERQLSYAGLGDLLEDLDLHALPRPQRRALDVALLRAEPAETPPDEHVIAAGVLSALRAPSADEPLLIAIDDVQWLDAPTTEALAFAARRLREHDVRFLLTRRSRTSSALERVFARSLLERVHVSPLSLDATRRLLAERLGLGLPRRVLRDIYASSRGNPLFALELGRTLAERGMPEIGEELVVPDAVEDLLGARFARLPAGVRRLVLALALSGDLRLTQLAAIATPETIDAALDSGALVVDGAQVRLAHPLLGAAATKRARARERRELHLELAGAVAGDERRARHLAFATRQADGALAATVASAAAAASARGAVAEAVELGEHALRLTPPEAAERPDRLLALAEYLDVAGEDQRVSDLLGRAIEELPRGPRRARAHLLLADAGAVSHVDDHLRHLEQALAEGESDATVRGSALATKSQYAAVARVERIGEAEGWAREALTFARRAGPESERGALLALAWARMLRGGSIDDLVERFRCITDTVPQLYRSIDRPMALQRAWRGEIDEARALLARLLALADERGEGGSYLVLRLHLCELELRAGGWDVASDLIEEWDQSTDGSGTVGPLRERCRALLAAGRGSADEAQRLAAKAIAGADAVGIRWDRLEGLRAQGIAALLAHDAKLAAQSLLAVWEHTEREGIDEPGAFPVAPDLVEALVALGELEAGQAVTERLRRLALRQQHPWGLATVQRCTALIGLASPVRADEAALDLAHAAAAYEGLGLRFDAARSWLSLGRAQRRRKKRRAARDALEQAATAFDAMGSPGWSEQARSELARVGGRPPRPATDLTPAERRVVELAAEGRSNKQIAGALYVTVNTVEAHLSRAYVKLGVRSRAQLAGRLAEQPLDRREMRA